MTRATLLLSLAKHLRRYGRNRSGNVSMFFALAVIPLVGATGAAIDYSRANSARAAMQSALDATGLILSKDAASLTQDQLNSRALSVFLANFNHADVKSVAVTPTFSSPQSGSYMLQMRASGALDTTFAAIWTPSMPIGANAQVVWGMKRLELALALDNTGSMASSNKMTQLKIAAKDLLKTLQNAAKKPDDVKVAIVPFDTTVNLGTSYKDNDWFDYGNLDCNGSKSGSGCTAANWKSYWEGCVRDRTYPYDTQDDPPASADTKFPVFDCGSLVTLMPLTNDWTALNAKIDAMTPNGNTNVTIGLAWAWHALTSGAPLSEASAPKSDLDKVIILLTDGDNTESWKNSNATKVTKTSAIDARTKLACDNVKAANIKVYTVRVIDGNASLLSQCATNASMYYDVQNASQLSAVFSAIAQNLANLRLSK